MIVTTTQETLTLAVGDREYRGWVDEQDDSRYLAFGAGLECALVDSYSAARERVRVGLIVQALADADNPHRDDVAAHFSVTAMINPDRTVGVAA